MNIKKRTLTQRILSLILAAIMLLGMLPAITLEANAASSSGSLQYKTSSSGGWKNVSSGTDLFDLASLSTSGSFLWIHNTNSSASAEYVIGHGQYGIRGTLVLTSAGGNFLLRSGSSGTTVQMKGNGTIYVGSNVTVGVESATSIWCSDESTSPSIWIAGTLPGTGITALDAKGTVSIHNLGGSYTVGNGSPSTTNYHRLTLFSDANSSASASGYASDPYRYEGKYYYRSGTSADVSASASAGYHITGGTGTYTMSSNRQVDVTSAVNTHTVYFNNNGGSGTMSPQMITHGSTNYLTANTMTRTGYAFSGWRTSPSGGTFYANGANVTALATNSHGGSTTLYAQWTPNTYSVTYNKNTPAAASNAVTGSTAASTHTYDTLKKLTTNGYALTGWTFKGWSTSASGSVAYSNGQNVSNLATGGEFRLYAVWAANEYTLTLNSQGGKGGTTATVTYDSAYGFGLTAPEKQGYIFKGYYTQPGGAGTQYFTSSMSPSRAKWNITANTTLYAHWEPLQYTIYYYDGTAYAGESSEVYGDFTLKTDTFLDIAKLNYTFVGWNAFTDQNWAMYQSNKEYTGGLTDKNGDIVTLYAAWQENEKFTVTYNANGGRGEPTAEQVYINNDYTISQDAPTQENHDFLGWSTNSMAETAEYSSGGKLENVTANTTLYAVWKQHPKVSFHANGGVFASAVNAVYAAKDTNVYPTTISVTREGYTLAGWTTDEAGNGTVYTSTNAYIMGEEDVTLYAKWDILRHTVTAGQSGCTISGLNADYAHGETVSFTVDEPTALVYVNGTQVTSIDNQNYSFAISGNSTVVAIVLSSDQNVVSYAPNGGYNAPVDIKIYASGDTALEPGTSPTRTGYTFSGWSTSADATSVNVSFPLTITQSITLYAVWTPHTYSISFHANGGSGSMPAQSVAYGETANLDSNSFTKAGYQFRGWALDANGEITFKDAAAIKNLTDAQGETINVYAVWGARVTTLNFDANGGSLSGAQYTSVEYGKTLTDSLSAPTRQGYIFTGYLWDTGMSTLSIYDADMKPNAAYDAWPFNESEITVVAQWTPITYSIKLSDGIKELNYPYFTSVSYDSSITLPSSAALISSYGMEIPDGKYFAGWTNAPGSSAIYYNDAQEITTGLTGTEGATVYLYAVYKDIARYTVRYDANGGTGIPTDTNQYLPGADVAVKFSPSPVRDGYRFAGWAASSTAANATYSPDGVTTFKMGDDFVTLYAVWTPITYKLTYGNNGGEGTIADSTFTYGEAGTLSGGSAFTKTGHTLIGWATTDNGAVTYSLNGSVWNLSNQQDAEIALYAVWQANTYTVTFKNGDATCASTNVKYATAYGSVPESPTREGYRFAGWYTQPSGGEKITALSIHNTAENITLYAQWTAGSYTIVFDGNGGTVSPASKSVTHQSTYGTLPIPVKAGYVFDGWYTELSGGSKISADDTVEITELTTLYAHWMAENYTVTMYESDYATFSAGGTVSFGGDFTFTLTVHEHVNTDSMSVTANGNVLTPTAVDGRVYTYVISAVAADQIVAVTGLSSSIYTVTYITDGMQYTTAMALAGDKLTPPGNPSKSGYAFAGWYNGAAQWDFANDTISQSMTLNANWSSDAYTLTTRIVNSCASISGVDTNRSYAYGDVVDFTATPEGGYLDVGVFAYANGIKLTDSSFTITANTTLTIAPTNAATYPVSLNAGGGTIHSGQVSTYTQGVGLVLPTALTRTGYYFVGWQDNDSGEIVTEIPTDASSAKSFTAKWSEVQYIVDTLESELGTISVVNPSGDKRYDYGSSIVVTLTPSVGYTVSDIVVMANQTPLTMINGSATYIITADTTLYLLPAKSGGATYSAIATGYSGTYDGESHALSVLVIPPNLSISSYQWYKNGKAISGAGAATYLVTSVADSGSYYCVIQGVDPQSNMRLVTSNPVTVSIIPNDAGQSGNGGSSGAGAAGGSALVIVDGVEHNIGSIDVDGQDTIVTVDKEQLQAKIAESKSGATVEIIVPSQTKTASARMCMNHIGDMAEKNMKLVAYLGDVTLEISAGDFYIDTIAASLGTDRLNEIELSLTASIADAAEIERARQAAMRSGAELVGTPVSFTVTALYGGKSYDVTRFSGFTTRRVSLTAEEAASIATGAVLENGTLRHVPTKIYQSGGKWYADLHSMTNSTYVLLSYEKRFDDAAGYWYEGDVNEMSSRMVISGVSDTRFDGNRRITRAEFAAIIVRALGLPETEGSSFDDVPASAWYCGAINTAHGYGLVQGRGERRFAPNAYISRQEAMTMVQSAARLAGYSGKYSSIEDFPDSGDVAPWALDAARFNVGSGLIQGSGGQLNPTQSITRAETAALILRLLQKSELVNK